MPSAVQFDGGDDPAIAASTGKYVVSVHKHDGKLYYNAGTLTDTAIQWWQPKGTQFDIGYNDPCVALNDDGFIVSLHRSSDTNLYWNAGVVDPVNHAIDWWNGARRSTDRSQFNSNSK